MMVCFIPFLFITGLIGRPRKPSLTPGTTDIPTFRRSIPDLARELARARRYQRPLAIVVLGLGNGEISEPISSLTGEGGNGNSASDMQSLAHSTQLVSILLGSLFRNVMRESDIVTYSATEDRYVILLAESNEEQARQAVQRLDMLFNKRTLAHLRAGIAEFPSGALTLEDLVSHAQRAWKERPVGGALAESVAGPQPLGISALLSVKSVQLVDELWPQGRGRDQERSGMDSAD